MTLHAAAGNVRAARKRLQTQQPVDVDADADHEFLIMSVPDLVQLVCRGCGFKFSVVLHKALRFLHALVLYMSKLPDVGVDDECLLHSIIGSESELSVRFFAAEITVAYCDNPLAIEHCTDKSARALLYTLEHDAGFVRVYGQHVRTLVLLQHLKTTVTLYNRVFHCIRAARRCVWRRRSSRFCCPSCRCCVHMASACSWTTWW